MSRPRRRLKLGTCLTSTAAALIIGSGPAFAADHTLSAPVIASPLPQKAQPSLAMDLTIRHSDIAQPATGALSATDIVVDRGDISTSGDDMPAIATHSTGTTSIKAGAITTSGARSSGIDARGTGAISIDVGDIQTTGDFAYGVRTVVGDIPVFDPATGTSTGSPPADLTVTAGSIATGGFGADGLYSANLTTGTTNVTIANVSTQGAQAWGVNANGVGDVNVTVGHAETAGFNGVGIGAGSTAGDVSVTANEVATTGGAGIGILAQATSGNVAVTAGSVLTGGDDATGIRTVSGGNAVIKADYVTTHGAHADGISASGNGNVSIATSRVLTTGDYANGITATAGHDIAINAGTITTQGKNSIGAYAQSFYGGASIDADTITTQGENSIGAVAVGAGDVHVGVGSVASTGIGVYAASTGGNIDISAGSIATHGEAASGIIAINYSDAGKTSVSATNVTTNRDGSHGVIAEGFGDVAIQAGSVTTSGYNSLGILGYSVNGAVSVTADKVKTAGAYSTGITVTNLGAGKPSTVKAGDIDVGGDFSSGVQVISLSGGADIDVGSVKTAGLFGSGINVNTNIYGYQPASGRVQTNIKAGSITTSGNGGTGIAVQSTGDVSIDAGSIATTGDIGFSGHTVIFANGIATSVLDGDTDINVGSITTTGRGAIGIQTYGYSGNTTIQAGTISTAGIYAPAVLARSRYGDISVAADAVTTSGRGSSGIVATAYGSVDQPGSSVDIHAGTVKTTGDYANAIVGFSPYGNVSVDADTVSTTGKGSVGIVAESVFGNVSVTSGTVSTAGDASHGLFGHTVYGDVAVEAGSVATTGDQATGIVAYSNYGKASLKADTVTTSGTGSLGIFVGGGSGVDVTIGKVVTNGNYAGGVSLAGGSPYTRGDIHGVVGDVETRGFGSTGISATTYGDVDLDIGSVKTQGDYAYGVAVGTLNGNNTLSVDNVTTTGSHASAIYAGTSGGNLTIHAANVETNGELARGIFTEAVFGTTDITITGTVKTTGFLGKAVFTTAVGGDTFIHNQGTILTTGGYASGIRSNVLNGHAVIEGGKVVTTGDRSVGIEVFGVGELKNISVTADSVITSGDSATGINLLNPDDGVIGYGGRPRATIVATEAGAKDITLKSGLVQTSGANANAIQIAGTGKVTVDAMDTISAKASAMVVSAHDESDVTIRGRTFGGGNVAALITGSDVNVTLGQSGSVEGAVNGLIVGATGPYVAPPAGTGPFLSNDAAQGGTATIVNDGAIIAPNFALIVEAGTAHVTNLGTIAGALGLGTGDDVLTNSGMWASSRDSDFGAGTDVVVNSGTVEIRPGAQIAGNVSFLGLESFRNEGGMVDLRNGVAGDVLTLSGAYVGSKGARLGLDLGSGGTADSLVVGGAATGHTGIVLNATAANATLLAKPVTLVRAGAGTAADAFSIANPEIGFIAYGLTYDAASGRFTVTTRASSAVRRLAQVRNGAQSIWLQQGEAWSTHMAALRDSDDAGNRVWGQAYGKVDTLQAHREGSDIGYRQDYFGFQAGVDLGGSKSEAGNGFLFGLTGGYLSSNLSLRGGPERLRYDTVGLGGYASLRAGPLFVNLLGQYDHYSIEARDGVARWSDHLGGDGYGAEAEVGARVGGETLFVEPIASLAWQHSKIDTLHALGQSIDLGDGSTVSGKLGARVGGTADMGHGDRIVFYGRAAYVHTFQGRGSALLESGGTSDRITGAKIGDYGQGAIGANILTTGRMSGFIEGNLDVGRAYKGGGGRVGLRFRL